MAVVHEKPRGGEFEQASQRFIGTVKNIPGMQQRRFAPCFVSLSPTGVPLRRSSFSERSSRLNQVVNLEIRDTCVYILCLGTPANGLRGYYSGGPRYICYRRAGHSRATHRCFGQRIV